MMKQLCLCTPAQWTTRGPHLGGSHYVVLPTGDYAVYVDTTHVSVPQEFEQLPDLLDATPIAAAHAERLGVPPTHKAINVLRLLHTIHPLFKP